MKAQNDTLVELIQDAASQVGPLDGIDGEAMARRAIRHERARRGVIGGAVAIVLVALGAGAIWVVERPSLPALLPWVSNSEPEEVRSDGLSFDVPAGYEEFTTNGDPMWGLDPVIPSELEAMGGQNAYAPSWVAVTPAEDTPLVGELVGNPVAEVDVPGAVAARWSWYSADDVSVPGFWERRPGDGDFVGELDVELSSGTVVRLTMSLTDDDAPQETFDQVVRTVQVDGESAAPAGPPTTGQNDGATAYDKLEPADPMLQDPPSGWRPETFEGLHLMLPPELKSAEGTWGIWTTDSAESWEDLSITLWDIEAYDQPLALDEKGYRYEPPGTARGVATVGTDDLTGEPLFLGRATFYLTADGRNAFEVRYEGSGATEERWWQILASLDANDLTSR